MKRNNILPLLLAATLFAGCKIQNAPGAYLPAKGKVEVSDMQPEPEPEAPKVVPMPEPEPVEVQPEVIEPVEQPQIYVTEPELVEDVPADEPLPAEENVRTEKFQVVDNPAVVLKKYHVVIGSFGVKDNALNLQQQMRPAYDPVVVINDRGLYRVLLVSYDTYAETRRKVDSLRDQFPDAWVLIQKK